MGPLSEIVGFVAERQRSPATNVAYLGTEEDGIAAELDALSPPWASTVRVERDDGELRGAALVEWDEELGRAWVHGPWADDDAVALRLFDAVVALVPEGVGEVEVSGDVANAGLARLAAARGLAAGVVNHALVVDRATVEGWAVDTSRVRAGNAEDADAVAALHDAEFPATYLPASRLADDGRVFLVLDGEGYATGEVHADGEGFVDFVAVHPSARGRGSGRALVAALARELLATATRVALTVQDPRVEARALYESMGFVPDASLVGYRGPIRR